MTTLSLATCSGWSLTKARLLEGLQGRTRRSVMCRVRKCACPARSRGKHGLTTNPESGECWHLAYWQRVRLFSSKTDGATSVSRLETISCVRLPPFPCPDFRPPSRPHVLHQTRYGNCPVRTLEIKNGACMVTHFTTRIIRDDVVRRYLPPPQRWRQRKRPNRPDSSHL